MKENKQTYIKIQDYTQDMSYENEARITNEGRGPLDLTHQIDKLKKQLEETQGELAIVKGINNNSPEIKDLKKQLADARIIDSVHQKINGSLQIRVT